MQYVHQAARMALAAATTVLLLASAESRPKLDVPFVPTPEAVVDRMLDLAEVKPNEYVIDLGSGDGRIAIAAAKRGARALGVDIDPARINEAKDNAQRAGVRDRVTFRVQDLFQTDISKANVLTMYLLERVNLRLRPRILEQLRPGSRVVSHAFDMGDWEPDQRDSLAGRSVYFWVVPAKVDGRWKLADGETALMLDIDQQFQKFAGTARVGDRSVPVRNGRIKGAEISFTIDGRDYRGRVNGNAIEGERGAAGAGLWRATRVAG